jgi:23S rRNA pseudouridine1911/1915/1917 synthase
MDSLESRVLCRSEDYIVINKLKGESVESSPAKGMVNMPKELSAILPADTEVIEAVHRLDVPVTGCVLFALTKKALSFLNAAFAEENSSVKKIYWAIIEKPSFQPGENGEPSSPVELVHWIETNTAKNKSFAYNEQAPGRKKASLRYRVTGEGTNYFFVEIELVSGRHHQIRAQFEAAGLHIKGDLKYGAKRSEKDGGIRLHARSLCFPDPLNPSQTIKVTAGPPQADNLWRAFINSEK